jgi:hypothetical protein
LDIKFPVDGLYSDKSEMALYVVELRVEEVHGGQMRRDAGPNENATWRRVQ